ncbi:DUF397 domain-containing protein [Amycolatopsis sp. cmx-11-12]|uniref:DUF397 domain-containing protein n=1 Tax=Amycolatopsis sp. cmx-11-12 TaxID=2785795 RepID=UPI0039182660
MTDQLDDARGSMSRPLDNKVHVRPEVDLSTAAWTKTSLKATYTVVRQPSNADGQPLVFHAVESDAFAKGVHAGEFDLLA